MYIHIHIYIYINTVYIHNQLERLVHRPPEALQLKSPWVKHSHGNTFAGPPIKRPRLTPRCVSKSNLACPGPKIIKNNAKCMKCKPTAPPWVPVGPRDVLSACISWNGFCFK